MKPKKYKNTLDDLIIKYEKLDEQLIGDLAWYILVPLYCLRIIKKGFNYVFKR